MIDPYRGLPRRIWAGSFEFPIEVLPRGAPEFADGPDDDPADAWGITHFGPGKHATGIFLTDDMNARELFDTVWHEITHVINHVSDLDLHSDDLATRANDEDICDAHGKLWTQFWLDNPRMQAWLTRVLNSIRRSMKDGE